MSARERKNVLTLVVGLVVIMLLVWLPLELHRKHMCEDTMALYPGFTWRYQWLGYGCEVLMGDEWVTDVSFLDWLARQ